MESAVRRPGRRGRKRRRGDASDTSCVDEERSIVNKKPASETRSKALVGQYLRKEFSGSGYFLGKIVSYDSGLYRVDYEDGDCEDLETSEIRQFIVDTVDFDLDWMARKKKLDGLKKKVEEKPIPDAVPLDVPDRSEMIDGSSPCEEVCSGVNPENIGDLDIYNTDSFSDSCEYTRDASLGSEMNYLPVQLPYSSGNIGVPEEYVSNVFSVYSFLRSFSTRLFLSPFTLDDFVGSLNCNVQNTLTDSIHFALMRALKRQLETLSSDDGSLLASKCLRCLNWSLLDALTWSVYMINYFIIMGYVKGPKWNGFLENVLRREYYTVPVRMKLTVLEVLCDDVLDSAELRAEIDMREESELGGESDYMLTDHVDTGPRRVHPRYPKTSACNDQETSVTIPDKQKSPSICNYTSAVFSPEEMPVSAGVEVDGNVDECRLCGMDGTLLCCDGCPSAYHSRCIGVNKTHIPEGAWFCPECTINKPGPIITKGTTLRGAEAFGVDCYEQIFLASCNHLLVLKISSGEGACLRYYSHSHVPKVLRALCASAGHAAVYMDICKRIASHWNIDDDIFSASHLSEIEKEADPSGRIEISPEAGLKDEPDPPCTEDLYLGLSFKAHTYMNCYIQGDFAASAAASLAVLATDENHVSDACSSESRRKILSANISLQTKAFTSAALRFFWPNAEKKGVDVPRERCGWCLSCKAPASSKRACLLNSAALNATMRGTTKMVSCLRSTRNEGVIASIATYMIHMEESLCGFVLGPFLHPNYRRWWRQCVEQATTFRELRDPLLKLEESINVLAFIAGWTKLVDLWLIGPIDQIPTPGAGTVQKRGPGRKRKHFPVPEVAEECPIVKPTNFTWWRGGRVPAHVLQKGTLPRDTLKKSARTGGTQKMTGLHYTEGSEIPKRSWQTAWRAAVEKSRTASQLALQIRYLDDHIKWCDLVRPDQNAADGRGVESEAGAFRNACICSKRCTAEDGVQYDVSFGGQKHLPSSVLKNIASTERGEDGRDRHWFTETSIPLYLIKDYEERMGITRPAALDPTQRRHLRLTTGRTLQAKASHAGIFHYLISKRDKLDKCPCVFCKEDVQLESAVKCSRCDGYCHCSCAVLTSAGGLTCKQCYKPTIVMAPLKPSIESPTSPLPSQSGRKRCRAPSGKSGARKNPRSTCSWGIIWRKKKNEEDTSAGFRLHNVILKGNPRMSRAAPVCHLCRNPYNPDLMYVCCENCRNWCHADALEVDESKLGEVLGYKCCKCRRIKSPSCPHKDGEEVKMPESRPRVRVKGPRRVEADVILDSSSRSDAESTFTYAVTTTTPAAAKLPVCRLVKCPVEGNGAGGHAQLSAVDRDDVAEYEPQTYFSVTELLTTDDDDVSTRWDVGVTRCCMCLCIDPMPELCCALCGTCIHVSCSPWGDCDSSDEWRCGQCRQY